MSTMRNVDQLVNNMVSKTEGSMDVNVGDSEDSTTFTFDVDLFANFLQIDKDEYTNIKKAIVRAKFIINVVNGRIVSVKGDKDVGGSGNTDVIMENRPPGGVEDEAEGS